MADLEVVYSTVHHSRCSLVGSIVFDRYFFNLCSIEYPPCQIKTCSCAKDWLRSARDARTTSWLTETETVSVPDVLAPDAAVNPECPKMAWSQD